MKLLLDTHALLWWLSDDEWLGSQARDLIADAGNDVLVSIVSLWEIAVKVRIGKLEADIDALGDAIPREGFVHLPVTLEHLRVLAGLPTYHRDPFDHLLMAQAISEDAVFMSEDRHASRYPVRVVTCSDGP